MQNDKLSTAVRRVFGAAMVEVRAIGSGINGKAYRVTLDRAPYAAAVKISEKCAFLQRECDTINYIRARADIKLPEIYGFTIVDGCAYMFMQYFDGFACSDPRVLSASAPVRERLSAEIAENIMKLQDVKGEKFGEFDNPTFESWTAYYAPFVHETTKAAAALVQQGVLEKSVFEVMLLALERFERVFSTVQGAPTLTHGDYWASNLLVDDTLHLIGVVDPFHSLWADSEYELFALNAVYGDRLPVLESFRSRRAVSDVFDLKNEYYILFSEVKWVIEMRHDNNAYLKEICDRVQAQFRAFQML